MKLLVVLALLTVTVVAPADDVQPFAVASRWVLCPLAHPEAHPLRKTRYIAAYAKARANAVRFGAH